MCSQLVSGKCSPGLGRKGSNRPLRRITRLKVAMKGYRTPSWFRIKGRLKERRAKAYSDKPKTGKAKKMERRG